MDVTYIETIPFYDNITAKIRSDLKKNALKKGSYKIFRDRIRNSYMIASDPVPVEFDLKNPQDKAKLNCGSAHICQVKSVNDDGSFVFDLYVFADEKQLGRLEILAAKEKLGKLRDLEYEALAEHCSIKIGGENYFIIQGDYNQYEEIRDDTADEQQDDGDAKTSEIGTAFSILCENKGKCYLISVCQKNKTAESDEKYLCVSKAFQPKDISAAPNFHLVKAELVFSDQKVAASKYNLELLKKLTEKSDSYLKAWKDYTNTRGNKILKKAREFGALHYHSRQISSGSAKLYFNENDISEKIKASSVEEIVIYDNTSSLPVFLEDQKCSFLEYCEKKKKLKEKDLCCAIKESRDNWIEIVLPDEMSSEPDDEESGTLSSSKIPEKGFIVMSMKGEETQIARHHEAWDAVSHGIAGIPHLGNLLEGDFKFMPAANTSPKPHISNRIHKKIFKNDPTPRQKEAIDIAIQTPDIALIQGPPGTGKTTVITAILEILNEIQDKRGGSAGRVLVSSYQHDAVENMIERIRVNSLPAWKYGKRRSSEKNYNEHINAWCKEIEDRVFALNPNVSISGEEETFHAYTSAYIFSPTPENRERLLEHIKKGLMNPPVPRELASEAEKLLKKYSSNSDSDKKDSDTFSILRKIRALRTTENSFADDGLKRAKELSWELEDRYWFDEHKDAEKILMDVIEKTPDAEQLAKLRQLKTDLLEEFSPKPLYVADEADEDIVSLCKETQDFLETQRGKMDKKEQIVADWIQALQAGSEAFACAVKECDFVYAATSQQSVGRDILKQKKVVEGAMSSYANFYDTVIIDEAARATPPDLLIPMCKAVKRIILVGDHRQLPQLIDDNIVQDTQEAQNQEGSSSENPENLKDFYKEAYEMSLFEILFNKLKDLEKKDHIKRTVTLDKQYLTHPVLGKFCSRLFYEPYNEGYESPRPAEDFAHSLPGIENKAAVWIDIPKKSGSEKKYGTSRIRECEADCIVEKLIEFVSSRKDTPKEEKKPSFGIITFYKAQSNLIEQKLKRYADELKDVTYKVGTVDAFQGMEFDVVFLSIVRTDGNIDFLTPNRLCVSMSRQKKVLIAVGCKDFVTSEKARSLDIPALSEFYDLCDGKNDEGYGEVLTWSK